jgi:hypothetical protein
MRLSLPCIGAWRYTRLEGPSAAGGAHSGGGDVVNSDRQAGHRDRRGNGRAHGRGALADRFDQVVVLERDTLPSEPTSRAGTPQARHVHALLLSGQRALSELFAGFEQDLARAGAVPLRAGLDVRMERPGYDPFPQRDLGWFSYAVSRPTIERACAVAAQLFDMLARMSTSVSIAGFACRIGQRALRRYRPDDESGS